MRGRRWIWPTVILPILLWVLLLGWWELRDITAQSMASDVHTAMSNDLTQMRTAALGYRAEYGVDPPTDPKLLLRVLQGEAVAGYNSRKIVFLKLDRVGHWSWLATAYGNFNREGELIDRWGRPFVWETDGKGRLAVWSRGPEGKDTGAGRKFYQVVVGPE